MTGLNIHKRGAGADRPAGHHCQAVHHVMVLPQVQEEAEEYYPHVSWRDSAGGQSQYLSFQVKIKSDGNSVGS